MNMKHANNQASKNNSATHRLHDTISFSTRPVKLLFLLWSLLFIALYNDSAHADLLDLPLDAEHVNSTYGNASIERAWRSGVQYNFGNKNTHWISLGLQKTALHSTYVPNFKNRSAKSWVVRLNVASKDFW